MKKLTFLLAGILLISACGSNKKTTKQAASATPSTNAMLMQSLAGSTSTQTNTKAKNFFAQEPINQAILISDFDTFSNLVNTIDTTKLDSYLAYAVEICNPYRRFQYGETTKPVCQKENNAKIIQVLANLGAKSDKVRFFVDEGYTNYQAKTIVSDLKEWNPMAVRYVVAKLDKCLVALTQMQDADDTKANYYVYADVWRNNNCSTANYKITHGMSTQEDVKLYKLIGADKEAVQKEYGTAPTIYDHPSQHREILTYKTAHEHHTGVHYFVEEYHYIFTLDRGVVTKVQKMHVSTTSGTGNTEIIDQEKLKQLQQKRQENFKDKPTGAREKIMRGGIR